MRKKVTINAILSSFIFDLFLLASFKKIRSLLPPPEIENNKLIGFSQYFGYPFYIDAIFFFILFSVPVLFFVILYLINKRK